VAWARPLAMVYCMDPLGGGGRVSLPEADIGHGGPCSRLLPLSGYDSVASPFGL
jgi:hypothetical protein